VVEAVKATIASNAPLVEKAQAAISDGTTWGVVYGGDTTLESARDEVGRVAEQLGITGAAIYFRLGSFRSVAIAATRGDAEAILVKARARRSDAYVVQMATWCPHAVEKTGYRECVS
jgi:hypothetical protein